MPGADGEAGRDLSAAMRELWEDARPRALQNVEVLEDAIAALLAGELGDAQREAARGAAHKLAGSLGTFGIGEGTTLARGLEQALEAGPALADVPALAERVLALRRAAEGGARLEPVEEAGPRILIAGLPRDRSEALLAQSAERGWRARTTPGAPEGTPADVALVGPGAGDAVAALRTLAQAGAAVAATDDAGDRVELVRAGAQRLLPPDLAPSAVVEELAELAAGRQAAAATIVGVDDDPVVLGVLDATLTAAGHRFVAVAEPGALWDAFAVAPPDLVVLDVQMPGTSGTELCRALRAQPRWRATPVLFLTAATGAAEVAELFAAGGDDYVPKPVAGTDLVARVNGRLERTRQLAEAGDRDERTGLLRQAAGSRALAASLAVARRIEQPFSVAAVRADDLDERTDRDAALGAAATALRGVLAPGDVAVRGLGDELFVGMLALDGHEARSRAAEAVEAARSGGSGVTLSAGVAEFPADGADAGALVQAAIAARRAAAAAGGDRVGGAHAQDRIDVVLVEDDDVLAEVVLYALETRGYRARRIDDGAVARRELGGDRPALRPDLVLLDWDLPSQDGLSVLRALAADGVLQRTRVIMLTLRASEREALAALELGATDHIAKPFSLPILMQRVRRVLAR